MSAPYDQRTVAELVSDVVNQFSKLIRNELAPGWIGPGWFTSRGSS